LSQNSTSSSAREKEIAAFKSSESEKDSTISSLQLELGQLQDQLNSLKQLSTSAPTPEQLQSLTSERDTLKQQLSTGQTTLEKIQSELQNLRDSHTALEKDTKTTHETLVSLRAEHSKLKETHSSEIQRSRTSHSRAAELQIENKTLLSRVDELKQKLQSLTSEKLDLVNRSESLEKELYHARKTQSAAIAAGQGAPRGSVELNTELDALIQGQEKRATIRETNQRRYSQFVGQSGEDREDMREINERRLKEGKDSGEFGREREMGFVIDLIANGNGGCGMCTGEVLVL
jgi:chromosome segregation ATPase